MEKTLTVANVEVPNDQVSIIVAELIKYKKFLEALPPRKQITINCGDNSVSIEINFKLEKIKL